MTNSVIIERHKKWFNFKWIQKSNSVRCVMLSVDLISFHFRLLSLPQYINQFNWVVCQLGVIVNALVVTLITAVKWKSIRWFFSIFVLETVTRISIALPVFLLSFLYLALTGNCLSMKWCGFNVVRNIIFPPSYKHSTLLEICSYSCFDVLILSSGFHCGALHERSVNIKLNANIKNTVLVKYDSSFVILFHRSWNMDGRFFLFEN